MDKDATTFWASHNKSNRLQDDFKSSKSTIQLKLAWKTEPFSAVRNAKPEIQPGSQTSHAPKN